jgi:TRAP-type C4-dicarboxylate transport system permease large subunit
LWIGILIILEVEIAAITPPIGMNVYVLKSVAGNLISIGDLFRSILPFLRGCGHAGHTDCFSRSFPVAPFNDV